MENREIFALLCSEDPFQILTGISELERFKYTDYKMPADIAKRMVILLRYKSTSKDPEEAEALEETITHAAAMLLAFTFGEDWMLEELGKLLVENASPELTLGTAVGGVFALGTTTPDKKEEAIKLLARTAVRPDVASEVKNEAYQSLLRLTGKIDKKEYAKQLANDVHPEFDLNWLKTLI